MMFVTQCELDFRSRQCSSDSRLAEGRNVLRDRTSAQSNQLPLILLLQVEFLCERGADVNRGQRSSSLHYAACFGRPQVAKVTHTHTHMDPEIVYIL